MPTWNMVPKIHLAVPLSPRGALLFLFLLSCMVFLSLADSKSSPVKSLFIFFCFLNMTITNLIILTVRKKYSSLS